jgi:hypothetical protein
MKHIKLFENTEPSIIEEVKKIVDENQYITDKDVTDDKLVVSDKWVVYISKGTMDHIKSHMSPSVELGDAPGSYYTKDWKVGVKNVISKNEPQVSDKPPFRTAWTGLDSGVKVGFVTIGYDDKISKGELDGYKKYTYERPVRDSKVKETILIKVEDAKETNFLTIVGAKVGEVSGKGLISLWTTYPDFKDGKVDGKDIPMNRSEFEKSGFYFKCTKEFFDKVPNEVSESKRFKYLKTFESFSINESFGRLYESVDDDYVVKPYEFETPEDWEKEFDPKTFAYRTVGGKTGSDVELNSDKKPPQEEIDEFESYLDARVEDSEAYGSEDTFKNIIEDLLMRSIKEMFKTKTPNCGTYFWCDNFFSNLDETTTKAAVNWHKKEDKIKKVVENFMSDFSTDSEFEEDEYAKKYDYESPESGSYSGTTDFKGNEVFSWSSGGDGYGFGGTVKHVDLLYKEIKDYLTMIIYM